MKLAAPMAVAWYLAARILPPRLKHIAAALAIILLPTLLVAKQPDLGTAILIAAAGSFVLLLAGLSGRYIATAIALIGAAVYPMWEYVMHDYQRKRILTLLNPEEDKLGAGWNIIQSKTAIGSGGFYGKGWLQGTQSHLDFLPEGHTDFIIAVLSEEWGPARRDAVADAVPRRNHARHVDRRARAALLRPPARRQCGADFLCVRVREYGNGRRLAAGGRCTVAADPEVRAAQRWWCCLPALAC